MNDQEKQLDLMAAVFLQLQQLGQAAEKGDQQAQAIMQEIQKRAQAKAQQQSQQPQMAKCGAKLKRKEDGGIVADKCGAKMKKKALGGKADCNCKKHLARQGGKLVTVDCNGNIIK